MTTQPPHPESTSSSPRVLEVELLALDLTSCTRCTGTLANIEEAIESVRRSAEPTGITIRLQKILIESEAAARRHRFVSSPTIRVDGQDIVFETLESPCDSCSDLCGCAEVTSCRVWRYQGRDFTEAPVGLVVESLRRVLAGPSAASPPPAGYPSAELPENLRRFSAGRAASSGASTAPCCSQSELASCCASADKAVCCAPAATSCGCA